jgi:hypothetical protein
VIAERSPSDDRRRRRLVIDAAWPERDDGRPMSPAGAIREPCGAATPLDETDLDGAEPLQLRVAAADAVARKVPCAERPGDAPLLRAGADDLAEPLRSGGKDLQVPLRVE